MHQSGQYCDPPGFIGQHAVTINREGVIMTATGDGRVGFVDADDIAEVAVRALINEQPHNTAHLITGPDIVLAGFVTHFRSDSFFLLIIMEPSVELT